MRSQAIVTHPEPEPIDWQDTATVERVRAALQARARYRDDDPGAAIELVQTHISSVFLTPSYVFKFKRPVELGFADFHTLALRERYCRAELELNRRLAEGVYLDVLPLCTANGGYALEGDGPVVDWCVAMRHLPAADMLDARLKGPGIGEDELEALAQRLVDFHRQAQADGRELAHFGDLSVVRENWDENFRQTEAFVGEALSAETFQAIRTAVEDWMVKHRELLAARAEGGFIRDGHGDLRCEHVYLGGGAADIKVIDCIEFNERFRYGDVANDLAFLLMDLTAQGHPALSRALLERYVALSGDAHVPQLVPFYACYRAYVRGKVTAFKLGDRNLPPEQRDRIRERARAFFRLALEFTRQMRPPVLVLVGGLMGTGKTALARALAARMGLRVVSSDAVRKDLAGAAAGLGAGADFGEGIYTAEWNARTYAALFDHAAAELGDGQSVILDASFGRVGDRERARALADSLGARTVLVECRLDEARTRERLRRREREGGSLSDGREALYARQRAAQEPVEEFPPGDHLVVVTDRDPETLAAELEPRLGLPVPLFTAAG